MEVLEYSKIDTGSANLVPHYQKNGIYSTLSILLEDKVDGLPYQDIVRVEPALDDDLNRIPDTVWVYVYADAENEDFTHKFAIRVRRDEEDGIWQ